MEGTDTVVIETYQDNIKIVRYNKPRRKNAIDVSMYTKITKILNEFAEDESVLVTVLTGTGDYYSSGNDIKAAIEAREDNVLLDVLQKFFEAFIRFPKLLVAVVNGPAIGVAATTLALCDMVFAAEDAFFYTPFTKLGMVAEGCSSVTFPRLMGDRKASEMLMFNHKMSAKEALDCGFINDIFKPEELQNKVWDRIVELSQLPKQSVASTKKLLRSNLTQLLKTNKTELKELEYVWNVHLANGTVLQADSRSKL